MKDTSDSQKPALNRASFAWRSLSRRRFFRTAAGTGAGVMLGSKVSTSWADDNQGNDDDQGEAGGCLAVPRPIPHINHPPPVGAHFFFAGHVDGSPSPTDPTTGPLTSRDPSIITDFKGVFANADLSLSGTGTDLNTGASAPYDFHCDMRFMKGVFVGLDNQQHQGEIGFV